MFDYFPPITIGPRLLHLKTNSSPEARIALRPCAQHKGEKFDFSVVLSYVF